MSINIANEIWSEIKRYIPKIDREEASEMLIDILVGNGHDIAEIKDTFADDADVKRALSAYSDGISPEEDYDDEEEEDQEDRNW